MKKLRVILLAVVAGLIFSSCEKIEGEGPLVTEQRQVNNFKGVSVNVSGKVYYSIDPVFKVEVRAQQNILNVLYTEVIGDELVIKYKDGNRVKSHEDITVYISAPVAEWINLSGSADVDLSGNAQSANMNLRVSGSGNIHAQQLTLSDRLTATISGSGNITASNGTCINETLKISGSGKMEMSGLASQKVNADISGSGDIQVKVSQNLDASISGSGSVFYKGVPLVSTHISGSGTVRPF